MPRQPHDSLTTAEKALHDQTNLLPSRQLIFCLCILSLGQLISFIDQNGISTALPTIAADLDAGDTISWAGTASLLANTTCQMLYGRASDIFGRKTVLISAVLLLALGDLVCGLSTSAAMFYVFRGVAGIGSGGITNLTMIILSDVVTLEQRGKYQGIVGSMIGLGSVTGPFFSAAFVSRATWRGFFWMLAPLGALNALLAFFYLPSKPPKTTFKVGVRNIDYLGALTSSIASILLLIPISGGGSYFSWYSPLVISMLVIGTVALVIFLISQWKLSKLPMMPIDMYRTPAIALLLVQTFLLGAVYQTMVYYIPLYLLNAHRLSVFASAAIFASLAGIQAVMSAGSGFFISHFKKYGIVIRFGFAMWTLGAGLSLIFNRQTSPGVLVICLLIIGIGVGCVFQPTLVALQSHSVKERRAVIISARNFNRSAGGACGLAISAATLQARLRASLPPNLLYLAKSSYALPNLKGGVPTAVLDAYMSASHMVFIVQVPLIAVCFLGSILLRDRGLIPVGTQAVQTSPLTDRGDQREVHPGAVEGQEMKKEDS
ncbi:major facilitator superfamily domain-containing protein [Penicillium angulare]|uniref:Major facilitator superfamily domain-containing protein n=1 Tax=Penicillium angulare TaxID=116970 RepID=A0A9W9EVC6_9EURO|nr:major facilitator superfamily domain-containing protein [Penicillium angulare]